MTPDMDHIGAEKSYETTKIVALSQFFHSLSYFKRFKTGEVYVPAFPGLYGLHKFGYGGEISFYFSGVNADLHRAVGIAGAELLEACLYAGTPEPYGSQGAWCCR